MTSHIMLDLETLGSNSHSPIVSIGAVAFEPRASQTYDELMDHQPTLNIQIDIKDAMRFGKTDPETLSWWLSQSHEAIQTTFFPVTGTLSALEAMESVRDFIRGTKGLWGNGASFDNVILRNFYQEVQKAHPSLGDFPLPFWTDNCYRTLKNLLPYGGKGKLPSRPGTHHHAIDDAVYQAQCMQLIFAHKGL